MRTNYIKLFYKLTIAIIVATSLPALCQTDEQISDVLTAYKKGDYFSAKEKLIPLKQGEKTKALAYYWEGVIETKLQAFDKAIAAYEQAIKYNFDGKELYYEYAQALYASDRLDKAKMAFGKSVTNQYKIATSLYYIAYISQTKNELPIAIKYYKKIAQLPKDLKNNVEQSAMYQLGEIYNEEAKRHPDTKKMIQKFVLPQYEIALDVDTSSEIATEIEQKIYQLKADNQLMVTKMINGRPVPKKRYTLNFSLDSDYDSNVILEADEATTHATNKDSMVYKGTIFGKYQMTLLDIAMLNPEIRLSKTYHGNRNDSALYENDTYGLNPALRTSWEHTLFDKKASFLIDGEYSYSAKDYEAKKDLKFFNRSITFAAGEKLNFFDIGSSTLKYKRRHSYSYNPQNNSVTTTFNATQMAQTANGHTIVMIGNINFTRNTNETNDTDNLNLIVNYIFPTWKFFEMPTLGMNYTITDTKLQTETRGTEQMFSPTISASKIFNKDYKFTGHIDYTKQTSKNKQANAYTKWVTGIQFAYNF